MARKRKATKAEIIKRILDEDAQREEETGYGFALDMGGREYARKALNRDTREELLAEWFEDEGTWDGYFWVQAARKNPSYEQLSALPAEAYLDPENFVTPFDAGNASRAPTKELVRAKEQYERGLDEGRKGDIHISNQSVWSSNRHDGSMVQSYEGIGYHAHTASLLAGFLAGGGKVFVHRRGKGETQIAGPKTTKKNPVGPGQKFVIVDVSIPGGQWVDEIIYDNARKADREAAKLLKEGHDVQVIDAVWFGPAESRLRTVGMRNNPRKYGTKRLKKKLASRFKVFHADHGISKSQMGFIERKLEDVAPQGFFIKQINLLKRLGSVPNAMYGPVAGDPPVSEKDVHYLDRAGRGWEDRMVDWPPRASQHVQVIGIRDGANFTLFTVYGGPLAPQHADDPTNHDPEASRRFWSQHALSSQQWAAKKNGPTRERPHYPFAEKEEQYSKYTTSHLYHAMNDAMAASKTQQGWNEAGSNWYMDDYHTIVKEIQRRKRMR